MRKQGYDYSIGIMTVSFRLISTQQTVRCTVNWLRKMVQKVEKDELNLIVPGTQHRCTVVDILCKAGEGSWTAGNILMRLIMRLDGADIERIEAIKLSKDSHHVLWSGESRLKVC